MNMTEQENNSSALRFPEFNQGWEERRLGKVLKIGSGQDYKHLGAGSIPVYGTGGYMASVDDFLYDGESVCIGRKGTIDKPRYLNEKFWTVDTLFYTHSFESSVPKFVYAIFQKINWKKHNEASGVPSLSKATIESIKVKLPPTAEQQKIADFLTAVDKRIEQLEEKKRLFTEYKKGVMQQIFSQQIRFKDDNPPGEPLLPDGNSPSGQPYPDWEECQLIKLSENGLSNGVFNDPLKVGRGYKLINVKDMYVGDVIDVDTLSLLDLDEKVFVKNKVEYGDIFFTRSSLVKSGIAYTNVNLSRNNDITYDGHLIRMRPKQRIVSPKFLAYFFKTDFARRQLIKRGKTTTMTTIGQDDVAEISIVFPTYKEQQKIAAFLTSIDNKIEQVSSQLKQAKTFKKGLLQQMFV